MRSFNLCKFITLCFVVVIITSCSEPNNVFAVLEMEAPAEPELPTEEVKKEGVDYFLPHIDLNNWKVTLPVGNPSEVEPPEILNYASNPALQEFMYNDSTDGSLVFYTYPGSTTANSSYSRTELREQMVPGSNSVNWKFSDGAIMEGELALQEISKEASGKDHRTMVMQIHGRLSNIQRDVIGASSNNAPPVLKVYWQNSKIRLVTKVLKDKNVSDLDVLKTSSWTDGAEHYFSEVVNNDRFKLKIEASFGKLSVTLNDSETKVIESSDLERWDIFENYFKAGNYLQSRDEGAFAKVKYYALKVSHP